MRHLSNVLFFVIFYYISLNSLIICCLSFGDIYLSFGIYLLISVDDDDSSSRGFFKEFLMHL